VPQGLKTLRGRYWFCR